MAALEMPELIMQPRSIAVSADSQRSTVVRETHRARGRLVMFRSRTGGPLGRFGVKWSSNWGQTGATRGGFPTRRARNNYFCRVAV